MEFIAGSIDIKGSISEKQVWEKLQTFLKDEVGYCGYKKPSISVPIEEIPSFVILSKKYGIVLIDVVDHQIANMEEDYWTATNGEILYSRDIVLANFAREIDTRLSKDSTLYNRREGKALLPISKIEIFIQNSQEELESFREMLVEKALSKEKVETALKNFFSAIDNSKLLPVSDDKYNKALSVLEGTDTLRNKQPQIKLPKTKNDFIQKSLEETFKLDEFQRQVAMQIADGPQRIRGLAGTGKTVILCLKAAIAHQEFPDYKILFLFHTRSMYPQIRELISKYYTREAKQPVNWDSVEVLHAWGGRTTEPGLYWSLCQHYNIPSFSFRGGVSLDSIFKDLLKQAQEKLQPVYDLVLIDEAQDLPPSVFETVFYLTKGEPEKKRIVWAYDEFQTLTNVQIKEPKDLFGLSKDEKPNLSNSILDGKYGSIDKDYVLANSYRNPRVVLMVAHGLTLGLYSQKGDIERIENRKTWNALGYQVIEPANRETFVAGDTMVVERPAAFSKNKLETLLKEHQKGEQGLIQAKSYLTLEAEIHFIVSEIQQFVETGKVDPTEIIVITLDTKSAKNDLSLIRQELDRLSIRSTIPGIVESASVFKEKGTVTLTTAFRAKGNEGNVVFVMNAQQAVSDSLFRARNALFVAITRARGWCYLSGHGNAMNELENEIKSILADYPCFKFQQPSDEEVRRRRSILSRQDDNETQKKDEFLDNIIQHDRDLLIEKIRHNPDILEAIKSNN
ncbi:hypothetical protein THII_0225 [Thioploca ingrica]|uniref:DNA 3'-5' helicase II n=1 Tax=Thioploca ingrica TaxID=40754 RepID=A0A090AGZ8_9GAMM|nr:hypothetical protein THII_0225 [Thioploca ingrica]